MSYRIEYHWTLFRVSPQQSGLPQERFIVAIEGGVSTLRDTRTDRQVRRWDVGMIGTSIQVLQQTVQVAGYCESGLLKLEDGPCTPETYIRGIRKMLESPPMAPPGRWKPRLRVPLRHPAVQRARSLGLTTRACTRDGKPEVRVQLRPQEVALLFDFVDRYSDLSPWDFAEVFGLPGS
jgi:hypothetical protein